LKKFRLFVNDVGFVGEEVRQNGWEARRDLKTKNLRHRDATTEMTVQETWMVVALKAVLVGVRLVVGRAN
jgi:hypothetical protein